MSTIAYMFVGWVKNLDCKGNLIGQINNRPAAKFPQNLQIHLKLILRYLKNWQSDLEDRPRQWFFWSRPIHAHSSFTILSGHVFFHRVYQHFWHKKSRKKKLKKSLVHCPLHAWHLSEWKWIAFEKQMTLFMQTDAHLTLNTPLILLAHFKSLFLHSFAKRLSPVGFDF